MKLSEVAVKPPKIILYGGFGSGKTCFAMTCGKYAQIIDLDEGLTSAKYFQDKFTSQRSEVDILESHETDFTKATAFMKARSYIQSVAEQCRKGTYPYKVLIIDSLTNLHEFCMRMVLSNSGKINTKPEYQHWQLRDIEFLNLCLIIKSLPIAVIVIAHQQASKEEESEALTPNLPGKSLPNNFFSKFDELIYLRPRPAAGGKTEIELINRSSSAVVAKTRSNFTNGLMVDIGCPELLKLMGYELK